MHLIDKTRKMYLKGFFILKGGTWEENKKGVSDSPQWDGFLKVLSISDLKFLFLVGVENLEKHRTQRELTKQIMENVTMIMDQSQTKSIDPEWSNMQNERWKMNGKTLLFITKY